MSDQENTLKHRPDDAGLSSPEKAGESKDRPKRKRGHGGECADWGWWEDRSLPQKILIGIGFGILGIGFLFLCGWVVMLLWNWLMPDIFGLKRLTYWQAWGLLILCHILFKGFGSGHSGGRSDRKRRRQLRRYMREDQATTEEAHEKDQSPG
jgi:hypothetical protein